MRNKNPETRRRQQTAWRAASVFVHGIIWSLMRFGIIKHLLTGYLHNSKFVVPSTSTIALGFASGNSWCLGEQ
jgi:hypothetical protein